MAKLFTLLSILAAVIFIETAPTSGQITTAVESETNFCIFLPPQLGGGIAEHEDDAVVFCTTPLSSAPDAGLIPSGFIKTAHFATGAGYVQVTGTIDRSKYNLSSSDGGGQYDSVGAPPRATCANSNKFVELVEPDIELFCIRCCTDKKKCNTGESTEGCEHVIPGDYS
ncbi:4523_t:CDS:1 [Paraglomus brasilianum]|uniref:4523_t:CDS:1 n=1 Tax=Paraglomus brasilianum TaxID=144538 RepID=A0A9N8YS91_9GLOM|nr:4523_t:CDS:1 [Paraglomus brasilianum]